VITVYRIRILDAAARDLAKLDRPIARRIVRRINWLSENLDDLQPEALTGDLSGFFKLRAGEYRILYEILREEQIIVIHLIGHRREIYRRR
jgi:mRNA interferase RelE/StbE